MRFDSKCRAGYLMTAILAPNSLSLLDVRLVVQHLYRLGRAHAVYLATYFRALRGVEDGTTGGASLIIDLAL